MFKARKLLSVFTPNASDVVADIESMIEVVGKLASFKGLAQALPNIEKSLHFATQLLSFVQKVTQKMPITPKQ